MELLEMYLKKKEQIAKIKFDKTYPKEDALTRKVKEYLDLLSPYVMYWKASDRFHPGISDIIICYKGKFVAIELKSETNEPTFKQVEFIQNVIIAGGHGSVCRTVRDVETVLSQI